MLNQLDFEDNKTIVAMIRDIVGHKEVLSNSQVQHIAQVVSLAYTRGKLVGVKNAQQIVEGAHHD
jgi:hypothetical protein